ncbi:MAG TPA: RagB/SusD family nutrient uptake outer membrane protein [Longimicrobiales bacterium]|nr:RagB/SusD family nutrient uptake outer membrane protein [Longimicrobiales bacterium]
MNRTHARWAGLCAAAAVLFAAGCSVTDDLLSVNNPDEIPLDQLDDPKLLQVRLNGVVDAFSTAYVGSVMQYSNFITDEIVTGLNWEDYARANERIVSYLEGPTTQIFENLSRSLRLADGLATDIERWAAADPDEDFDDELAETLIYAGYSALVLGENTCQAVISPDPDAPSETVLSQLETYAAALPYFENGLAVALRAGNTDLANLARTGLARTHLSRGEWAEAANYAGQVTAGFDWWIDFADLPGGRNPLQGTSHGGNFTHGIHPNFTGLHPSFDGTGFSFRDNNIIAPQTDPRIQHAISDATGHNGLTPLYKLFQGLRFSGYIGETIAPPSVECPDCTGTDPADMPLLTENDTDVLMADYLEAQHHYYEALVMQGQNTAGVLAFVNERRAAGNQPPVVLAGQALIDELRNQRARDLYMGGFRVPDLRRWTRFDPGNGPFAAGSYFPTGPHPNAPVWGQYGEWTCYPIPLSEYEGNPNLPKPADPNSPPGI